MIKILKETSADLLAIRIEGKVTGADFETLNPVLEKVIEGQKAPAAYIELLEPEKVTLGAVMEDLMNVPKYSKFRKIAIVAEKKWQDMAANFWGALMNTEIRYFAFEEKSIAMEWLGK